MVNFQSGLLGISEISSDMRDLLKHETQDVRAAEAVALFCYQVKKWIGSFAAVLGGIETLVFAGGIGENAPAVRARICDGLGFLGIELEEQHNAANAGVISAASSRVVVRVIPTDEEQVIAKTVCQVLGLAERGELTHEPNAPHLRFPGVCDSFRRQDIAHVETCNTNPAVRHPVINVEAIG